MSILQDLCQNRTFEYVRWPFSIVVLLKQNSVPKSSGWQNNFKTASGLDWRYFITAYIEKGGWWKIKAIRKIIKGESKKCACNSSKELLIFLFFIIVTLPLKDEKRNPQRNTFSSPTISKNYKFRGIKYHLSVSSL